MSDRSFGFGTRLYMCKALRSFSAVPLLFDGGKIVSFCNIIYAARLDVLFNPIIEKLCSGRVLSTFIFNEARWGNCIFGYSDHSLKKLYTSLDWRTAVFVCRHFPVEKVRQNNFFYPKYSNCLLPREMTFASFLPGYKIKERRNAMSNNLVGGDGGALLKLLGELIIIISK